MSRIIIDSDLQHDYPASSVIIAAMFRDVLGLNLLTLFPVILLTGHPSTFGFLPKRKPKYLFHQLLPRQNLAVILR
jgi:hypothetical protein